MNLKQLGIALTICPGFFYYDIALSFAVFNETPAPLVIECTYLSQASKFFTKTISFNPNVMANFDYREFFESDSHGEIETTFAFVSIKNTQAATRFNRLRTKYEQHKNQPFTGRYFSIFNDTFSPLEIKLGYQGKEGTLSKRITIQPRQMKSFLLDLIEQNNEYYFQLAVVKTLPGHPSSAPAAHNDSNQKKRT